MVKYLLKNKANVNEVDENKNTALMLAIKNGYTDIVIELAPLTNLILKNHDNKTVFNIANQPENANIFKILNEQKKLNDDLIENAQEGNLEQVTTLINDGANVNEKDEYGITTLILAIYNDHKDVAQLLLDHPTIDINVVDYKKNTALMGVFSIATTI